MDRKSVYCCFVLIIYFLRKDSVKNRNNLIKWCSIFAKRSTGRKSRDIFYQALVRREMAVEATMTAKKC